MAAFSPSELHPWREANAAQLTVQGAHKIPAASSTADLRSIGSAPSGNNLYVFSVLHKTYLELDENGTKAAAATVVEPGAGDAPPSEDVKTVTLDRPFLYMIVDTHANLPLFLGTVTQMDG